jgi:hypothetical protein
MTEAVLERPVSDAQGWIQLPGVRVADLRPGGGDRGAVELLRRELERGLDVDPDPRRANFYEASMDGYRYYFDVVPGRPAKVFLLARWREI